MPLTDAGDVLADLLRSPSMSGSFFFGQHTVFVSNRRLTTLVEFVLSTANDQATTDESRAFVDRFDKLQADTFFPGIDIDLEELFTSPSERWFWASAFAELAKRIERRRIGNPDQHDWRQEAADQAARIARMLVSNQDEAAHYKKAITPAAM